jgi:hypothetical protein
MLKIREKGDFSRAADTDGDDYHAVTECSALYRKMYSKRCESNFKKYRDYMCGRRLD